MTIRLLGYCRINHGDGIVFSPRDGGFAYIKDSADFLEPLVTGEDTRITAENIAQKYGVSQDEVILDMLALYDELARANLIEIHSNAWKRKPQVLRGNGELVLGGTSVCSSPSVADFYRNHNLLASLHMDITDACTERCVHCYVPQGQSDYIPYSIVEKVLREFREQQGLTVQLSGGECMMHPDFGKICRLCRKLDLNFIVLSNLTLCDEDKISVLKETEPQFVNVSLYSMKAEEHDAITRIRGSWKHTMAAIDACQNAGVHIRLATPLLKINKNAYSALRQFAHERRVHVIPDCDIIPMCNGDCSNLNYACTPAEVEAVLREDKAFWDREYGRRSPQSNDKVCDIGKLLCLNSKGDYYPCSGMHGYVLGNARNTTLTDVWHSERLGHLRSLKNKDFPKCANCEHRAFCKVCPAFNFNATGNLFETIPDKCALAEVKHRVFGGE